jgi:chromosome partitioning protein
MVRLERLERPTSARKPTAGSGEPAPRRGGVARAPSTPSKATVVAFLNFKGGVGKTTNVVNIGACLAATHQKRVLIVDLDAQCNASLWLLRKPAWKILTQNRSRSIYQLFRDQLRGTKLFDFEAAVVRGVPQSTQGFRLIGSLDLLPAVVELLEIEDQLGPRLHQGAFKFLFNGLAPHLGEYDYVLLDCPPSFFSLSKNAIFLAQHLAIPYIPDFLSLAGFQTLARLIERFGDQIGGSRTALGRTRISAILANRYQQQGNVFKQGLLELEQLVVILKKQKLIHPHARVLEPPIRSCVKVAEAPAVHLPILLHAADSIGGADYAAVTQAFVDHYEGIQ